MANDRVDLGRIGWGEGGSNLPKLREFTKEVRRGIDLLRHGQVQLLGVGSDYPQTNVSLTEDMPAVITGTEPETYDMSDLNLTLIVTPDSEAQETITFDDGDAFEDNEAATAAEIVAYINEEAVNFHARVAVVVGDNHVELVSNTEGRESSLLMGDGTANTALGFTNTDLEYGAQGLDYPEPMPDDEYSVALTLVDVTAELDFIGLSVTEKTEETFEIYAEDDTSDELVDILVNGL